MDSKRGVCLLKTGENSHEGCPSVEEGDVCLELKTDFSVFGGVVPRLEVEAWPGGEPPGSPVAGVGVVIVFAVLLKTLRRKRTRQHVD